MEQNKPTELKPCPFCGVIPASYSQQSRYDYKGRVQRGGLLYCPTISISCGRCNITMTCDADPESPFGEESYALIHKAWNTRSDTLDKRKGEWQPIETAPKDGTKILAINNRMNQAVVLFQSGEWHSMFSSRASSFINGGCGSILTHWMPLPNPPKQAEQLTKES